MVDRPELWKRELARIAQRMNKRAQRKRWGPSYNFGVQITQTGISKLETRQRYVMDYEVAANRKSPPRFRELVIRRDEEPALERVPECQITGSNFRRFSPLPPDRAIAQGNPPPSTTDLSLPFRPIDSAERVIPVHRRRFDRSSQF